MVMLDLMVFYGLINLKILRRGADVKKNASIRERLHKGS